MGTGTWRAALPHALRSFSLKIVIGALLVLAHGPSAVRAHAGPQVRGITLARAQAPNLLLSNRGLMFGPPGDSTWRLMCNEALGITTAELPEVVQFEDGRLLAACSAGLRESRNGGCDWQPIAPFQMINAPALTRDPSQPNRLYLTTFAPGQAALRVSEDGGTSWQQLAAAGDDEFLRDVRVAPSQPDRLYVRGLQCGSGGFKYSTWSSRDRGKNWDKRPIDIPRGESDFRLLAVSPKNPDLIVAKAEASNPVQTPERLLVSNDAGANYRSPISLHVLNAAVFSADGKQLWVGSDDGLFVSSDDGESFVQVGPAQYVDSLLAADGKLYLGGYYLGVSAGTTGVGVSSDGGQSFETWMQLTQVTQPAQCAPTTMTGTLCEALWLDWEREILSAVAGAPAAGSGGSGAAGAAAGGAGGAGAAAAGAGVGGAAAAGMSAPAKTGGGCSAAPARDGAGNWWLLLMAAAAISQWRRVAGLWTRRIRASSTP